MISFLKWILCVFKKLLNLNLIKLWKTDIPNFLNFDIKKEFIVSLWMQLICTKKNYDAFNAKCKYLANIYGIKLYYFYELYFAVLYEKTLKLLKAETEYFDELYENSKFWSEKTIISRNGTKKQNFKIGKPICFRKCTKTQNFKIGKPICFRKYTKTQNLEVEKSVIFRNCTTNHYLKVVKQIFNIKNWVFYKKVKFKSVKPVFLESVQKHKIIK